ncbi:MAG: hypothetical protein MJ189_04890, partial [Coriobacteriales bacterium]|nr:hypothetical protein [Coriobacteriales bacterium]
QSISFIPQSVADYYIDRGIEYAGEVSMNYGCDVPTVPDESIERFTKNVNRAKDSANSRIGSIKACKKRQYDEYQAYIAMINRILQMMQDEIGSGVNKDSTNLSEKDLRGFLNGIIIGKNTFDELIYELGKKSGLGSDAVSSLWKYAKGYSVIGTFVGIASDVSYDIDHNVDIHRIHTDVTIDILFGALDFGVGCIPIVGLPLSLLVNVAWRGDFLPNGESIETWFKNYAS